MSGATIRTAQSLPHSRPSVSLSATGEGTCAQSQRPIPPCPPRTCHYTATRACQLGGPWTRWLTTKDRNRINPASPGPSRPFPQCQRPTARRHPTRPSRFPHLTTLPTIHPPRRALSGPCSAPAAAAAPGLPVPSAAQSWTRANPADEGMIERSSIRRRAILM